MVNRSKRTLIQFDQIRFASRGTKGFFKALGFPCFRFILYKRIIEGYSKWNPIGSVFRFLYKIMQIRYGLQIAHYTKIGGGFYMAHYGNIVISCHAIIGENCNIGQGVTIGRINKGKGKGAPKIGDKVWIGPNAVLVGNISIGNNVLIAPLSFVNFDIPDNCMAIGNPAKIVEGKTSEDYINFHN